MRDRQNFAAVTRGVLLLLNAQTRAVHDVYLDRLYHLRRSQVKVAATGSG